MKVSLKGLPDALRGSAWPSSARAVRCPVKSGNERDLYPQLLTAFRTEHVVETALETRRKVQATIGLYLRILWATRAQQWLGQWDATPKGEANPLNPIQVQIEACNSAS